MEQMYLNALILIAGVIVGSVFLSLFSKKARAIIQLIKLTNELVKKDRIIAEKDDRILLEVEKNELLEQEIIELEKHIEVLKKKYADIVKEQKLLTRKVDGFIHLNDSIKKSYTELAKSYADLEEDFDEHKIVMAGLLKEWTKLSPEAINNLLKIKRNNS